MQCRRIYSFDRDWLDFKAKQERQRERQESAMDKYRAACSVCYLLHCYSNLGGTLQHTLRHCDTATLQYKTVPSAPQFHSRCIPPSPRRDKGLHFLPQVVLRRSMIGGNDGLPPLPGPAFLSLFPPHLERRKPLQHGWNAVPHCSWMVHCNPTNRCAVM